MAATGRLDYRSGALPALALYNRDLTTTLLAMSDYINPDAVAWLEENERLHRARQPHQWRLFGMVACRLCQADHDETTEREQSKEAGDA